MSATFYQSPLYQDLITAADTLHNAILAQGYTIKSANHKGWYSTLRAARNAASRNSRKYSEVTRVMRGRKILSLYQHGRQV